MQVPAPHGGVDGACASGGVMSEEEARDGLQRNVSTAQLLSPAEHEDLLRWASCEDGPWSEDLRSFPGPPASALGLVGPPVPLPASSSSASSSAPARGEEPYRPLLSGYDCELFRNEYLAWCAAIQLPEGHPDFGKRAIELAGYLAVHGGIAVADPKSGRLEFDCNHGSTDLVPYASFVSASNDKKRIGALADGGGTLAAPGKASGKGSGGLLQLPKAGAPPPQPKKATYKDYGFVRRELESLVAQLREREAAAAARVAS